MIQYYSNMSQLFYFFLSYLIDVFFIYLYSFRDKRIRVSIFRDYEFIYALYGIIGANGEWCLCTYFSFEYNISVSVFAVFSHANTCDTIWSNMVVLYVLLYATFFVKSLKKAWKLNIVKEEDVNYIHLYHFKKITRNLFSLLTILKMLTTIKMSLRRQYLTHQLICHLSYLFFRIEILLKAAPTNLCHFTKGDEDRS